MNHRLINYSISIFAAVLLAAAWPITIQAKVAPDKQAAASSSSDDVERHFNKAHENFLNKDRKTAAAEIHKAAAYVQRAEAGAAIDAKDALSDSAQELEKLAGDVKKGTVTSAKELDNVFARAHYALARNSYLKASASWTEKTAGKAGQYLKSAAADLEHGLEWTGHKAESATADVIKDARKIGDKMIEGAGWVSAEVEKGIADLGNEIEKFSKKIELAKK